MFFYQISTFFFRQDVQGQMFVRGGEVCNVGVVLRAVNQKLLIAGGNHTLFIGYQPPATFRIQPVRLNGTAHQRNRRGGYQPPGTFRRLSRAIKRYRKRRYICSGGRSLYKSFTPTFSAPVDKTQKLGYSIDTKGATSRSAPPELWLRSNRVCGRVAVTSYFYDQVSR